MPSPLATRVIVVDPDQPDPAALDTAAQILKQGGLVAFATETVYGLGAIATDRRGGRADLRGQGTAGDQPRDRPRGGDRAGRELRRRMARDGADDWPRDSGPARSRSSSTAATIIPDLVTAGHDTVAVRLPPGRSPRPDRTDGPADRGPQREPVEPALADPGRARAGRSRWSDRPDHRQRPDHRSAWSRRSST